VAEAVEQPFNAPEYEKRQYKCDERYNEGLKHDA